MKGKLEYVYILTCLSLNIFIPAFYSCFKKINKHHITFFKYTSIVSSEKVSKFNYAESISYLF